jgi:ABC-2 type transport system ATP-binding protein
VDVSDDAIVVEGLRKCFGEVTALDGVDFSVPTGTVLGLLGPNGAGKTTAVRVLTTILQPDGGVASVLGYDVTKDPQAVREHIGLAGQYAAVDENLTAVENLKLAGRLTHMAPSVIKQRTQELLARFALEHAANRPVRTYSGGMRRRLDLAAALVHRPPVLFLDEPTTGLDPSGRVDLWGVIEELVRDGTTLLLTTQYLEEADRLARNIVVIDHGTVIAEGTSAQLKARMGATIVEVGIANVADLGRACSVLSRFGKCDTLPGTSTIEVKVNEGSRAAIEIVRALDAEHLDANSLAIREPTLDDVFLTLTGHRAEEESAA